MRQRTSEKGTALITALIALLLLFTLAASMLAMTQIEVKTAYNYKLLTQSRYAAEAGIQSTINWLANNYTAPSTFTAYATTAYPVQASSNGQTVLLSALSGTSPNYPDGSVQTAYSAALSSQAIPGISNASFSTTATLLRMSPTAAGPSWLSGSGGALPQTWQITSVGSIGTNTKVQLQATYDRSGSTIFKYALEATGVACGTISISGSGSTDSFDSSVGAYAATHVATGGNVATNGNMRLSGSANLGGTFSAPDTTTGACPGHGITSGSPAYTGLSMIAALSEPNPTAPSPTPPTTNQSSSGSCANFPTGCTTVAGPSGGIVLSSSYQYGNISLSGHTNLHFAAGTYNINSISLSGNSQIILDSTPVVLNIAGGGSPGHVVDLSGGTVANSTGVASNFAIVYAGTLPITLSGGSGNYGVLYAPNSAVTMSGNSDWYGAIISSSYSSSGSSAVHYDSALNSYVNVAGSFMPLNFSWSKF